MASDQAMHDYYERDRERDRLTIGLGALEFLRTIEIISRTLPAAPASVADIGGGPGRYTDWLIGQGYNVIHRDPVPHHVDQVRENHGDAVDTQVGDACDLGDLDDESVDATLLLGPLYHLPDANDRSAALSEASRITRGGGMVYAAAIGRWSARIQGILVDRMYEEVPESLNTIDAAEETGLLLPQETGHFTAYTHTPEQFQQEVTTGDLKLVALVAVEGIASAFSNTDVIERLTNPVERKVLLDCLRALEAVPDLLGASSHLLATTRVAPLRSGRRSADTA